jgi:hypothetical protein
MRLPRFRVRTLMLLVAAVALLGWGAMMGVRSYVYFRLARDYGRYERDWREMAVRDQADPSRRARSIAVKWGPQIADFYAPLARKYRRAMWRPWIPVAPDPPAPMYGSP